jgi:hypothetical protein
MSEHITDKRSPTQHRKAARDARSAAEQRGADRDFVGEGEAGH